VNESSPKLLDLQSALAEMQRLREENVRLRCLLRSTHTDSGGGVHYRILSQRTHCSYSCLEGRTTNRIVPEPFPGRDDVYAVRWENDDGRSGYMPKADRDWKAYLRADDEDRKKVDRQTRKFRPLNDEVARGHLVGDHTIGIYPLLQDETCCFLAVDFDKKTLAKGCHCVSAVCCGLNVPAALERSRSGNGATVDILRPSDPRNHRAKTGLCNPD